jgi:CRP-like cAMP-binding protein
MEEIIPPPDCSNCPNVKKGENFFVSCPNKKFFRFQKGEYLFEATTPVEGIYCIYSGKVRICESGSPGKNHFISRGEIIGLKAIREGKHMNSAVADAETGVCIFPLTEVHKFIISMSVITQKIIGEYS